eukprot:scaffold25892_cov32-Tisochrysis_lutea.AAC.3
MLRLASAHGEHAIPPTRAVPVYPRPACNPSRDLELAPPQLKRTGSSHGLREHILQARCARVLCSAAITSPFGKKCGGRTIPPPINSRVRLCRKPIVAGQFGGDPHLIYVAVAEHKVNTRGVPFAQREQLMQEG